MLIIIPNDFEDDFYEIMAEAGWVNLDVDPDVPDAAETNTQPYVKQPIPPAIRWQVWERDNFTCKQCGSRTHLHVDHIKPESKGGLTTEDNLQTLCRSCNVKKGAKYEL